jgi:hypothetical protein
VTASPQGKRGIEMLFRPKPKPLLLDAIFLVNDASEVAFEYLRDQQYIPSENELHLFDALSQALLRNHAMVKYIARIMHQRAHGEPEAGGETDQSGRG